MTASTLQEWFSGPEHGLVPSFRPGQLQMAEEVQAVFEEGGIAFLEAGTGTGKSLAYGLPAMLSDKRVVISTGKKALQAQLIDKDLPHLARVVRARRFVLLKGKANYACALRWDELKEDPGRNISELDEAKFSEWLEESGGDLETATFAWAPRVKVAECVWKHCPHADACGYRQTKLAANTAEIVVVNHALLAQDLAVGGGKIFGPYDVLIIDEGHAAPKFFRDAFSLTLHPRQPEAILRLIGGTEIGDELKEGLSQIYQQLFQQLPSRGTSFEVKSVLAACFTQLYVKTRDALTALSASGVTEGEDEFLAPSGSLLARERAKLKSAAGMLQRVNKLCEIVLEIPRLNGLDKDTAYVQYLERRDEGEVQVIVTPIEIGPIVAPVLQGLGSVVVTSATLSTANGMNYMANEFGFEAKQLRAARVLPSPFNYAQNSALYVSATSPDPSVRGEDYYRKMIPEIHELLTASRGGAFVLCASTDDMNAFFNGIWRAYEDRNYRMAKQGNASPDAVIKWFKADPTSVLVALKTYWEGIDIPGGCLRLVVIPRLPFPNRADVVLNARKQAYIERLMAKDDELEEDRASIRAWDAFDFQEAIMDLKQGAGRLIRSAEDTGIVAILDKRAYGRTKGYSAKVRAALPHPSTSDKAGILDILEGFAEQALRGRG